MKKVVGVLLVALLAATAAGCGSNDKSSSSTSTSTAAASSTSSTAASSGGIKVKPRTIGMLDIVRSSPISAVSEDAIQQAAKALGWKVIAVDAKGDPGISARAITNFVNQKVDGIITLTVEASAIRDGLTQAKAQGIPTCQSLGQTTPSDLWSAQYEEDEHQMAKTLADYIVQTQPTAKVAYLKQSLNLVGARRGQAVKQVFDGAPSAKVVATTEPSLGDPVTAQKSVADLLSAHPEINAVYATMDAWGIPSNAAIRAARSKAKVYSFFTSPSNVDNLKKNTPYEAVVDDNIQKTALVCLDQILQKLEKGTAMDPAALQQSGGLTYNIVDRKNVNEKVKAGATGQFTNETELKPFLDKWKQEFPG
jgi:ABC-type sugar transport system substrate-binding protein